MELSDDRALILPPTLTADAVAVLAERISAAERVIVLRGAAPDCFCHGLDLEPHAVTEGPSMGPLVEVLVTLATGPASTLALVQGSARGGGVGVAAACDLVVASPDATFALPEMLFGLVPAAIWPVLLRRVRAPVLRRWAMTADTIDAKAALAAGLVDVVCEPRAFGGYASRLRRAARRVDSVARQRLVDMSAAAARQPLPEAVRLGAAATAATLRAPAVRAAMREYQEGGCPWLR